MGNDRALWTETVLFLKAEAYLWHQSPYPDTGTSPKRLSEAFETVGRGIIHEQ